MMPADNTHRAVVHKVLNNNLVMTIDPAGRELVLMGRGLGWRLQPQDSIDYALVEKTYVLDRGVGPDRIQQVLEDVPFAVVQAVTNAVDEAARTLGRSLSRHLPVAIIDHVQFVLERLRSGIRLPAASMPELLVLYPEEAAAALRMRKTISAALSVALPEEEAFFLTMHLLNSTREDLDGAAAVLFRRVQHIATLVQRGLAVEAGPEDAEYARFVVHIKFLLQRLNTGAQLRGVDRSFYELARASYPHAHEVAQTVRDYIRAAMGVDLTEEELLYLVVHIQRLADHPPQN